MFQKAGAEDLAKIVTKMCQMKLGLRTDIVWCNDADDIVCKELLDYIMENGNFGQKIGHSSRIGISG